MKRKTIDTHHSIDRFLDRNRFDDAGKKSFKTKLEWVINNAKYEIIKKYNDESALYGIHSKSTGIGLIINWREDYKSKDGLNHAIIVTILPIKKYHHFDKDDVKVIVESQIENWMSDSIHLKENKADRKSVREEDFHAICWEGKFYDSTIDTFFYVD